MKAGSSLTTDKNGVKTSEMRYKPWGEVRSWWTSALATTPAYKLADYTFTGQYSYMDDLSTPATEGFGLMFYNARFYDPALGRFTSADTIVPGGVQGLDRYAYANNSPIMYIDPSGHITLCGANCEAEYEKPQYSLDDMAGIYGVTFNPGWNVIYKAAVLIGVYKVANTIQKEFNSRAEASYQSCVENMSAPTSTCSQSESVGAADAFRAVYDHINFKWERGAGMCGDVAVNSGGCTKGAHAISFWSLSGQLYNDMTRMVKNVVHELGHAFDWTYYNRSQDQTRASYHKSVGFTRSTVLQANQIAGRWDWQQSPYNTSSEIFADMFIAWTYNAWNADPFYATEVNSAQSWMNGLVP